ncbi:MAG: FAD:protein FMN transferase [Bacteroidota bacterium]
MYRTAAYIFYLLLTIISTKAQPRKFHFSQMKMGSPFNIILVSDDSLKSAALADRSFALVDSFNHLFSDYDTSSELSKINALAGKGKQQISPALMDIVLHSQVAYKKSRGAFDITVGSLSQLWRKARKEKIFPGKALVDEKRKFVGFDQLLIDYKQSSIILPHPGMRLDLGGIAKGYIAQKVIDFLKQNGIEQALADAGGDMAMSNAPVGTNGWIVGVNVPETTDDLLPKKLALQNMAVATSGDAYQYMEHNGLKYSHIIDARTGYGIHSQRNVTVIAKDGADADWLATACSILPIEDAKKLAESMHAELLITVLNKGRIVYYSTKGFERYWKQ